MTDGLGNQIDFKNTIIIMTSRSTWGRGSLKKARPSGSSVSADSWKVRRPRSRIRCAGEVKRAFNPEFLNRLDDIHSVHVADQATTT